MANFGEIASNIAIGAGQSIRRNAGDTAFEAFTPGGGGGSPGGSSGQLQYNSAGAFGGTVAVVYSEAAATEHIKITAQAADSTQLLLQEHATQTAAVLRVVASDGATSRFSVIPSGYVGVGVAGQSGAQLRVKMTTATDIGVRILAAVGQSSDYIRLLDDAGTHVVSFNSSGYLAIGATTSATTMLRATVGTTTHNGIILQAHASQSSSTELLTIRSSSSVLWFSVSGSGLTGIGQGYTTAVQCNITPTVGTNVALRLRGHSAQSGDYFQILNGAGTTRYLIDSEGRVDASGAGTGSGVESLFKLSTRTCESLPDGINKNAGVAFINLVGTTTGNSIMSGGVSAETYRRIRIESGGRFGWSAGSTAEDTYFERISAGVLAISGSSALLRVIDTATAAIGVGGGVSLSFPSDFGSGTWARVKAYKDTAATSNVDCSVLVSCWNSAHGTLRDHTLFHHYGYLGVNKTASLGAMVDTVCRAATDIGLRIQAATSQSADLTRWVNAAGTTTLYVPAAGNQIANSSTTYIQLASNNVTISGGNSTSGSLIFAGAAMGQHHGDNNSGAVYVRWYNAVTGTGTGVKAGVDGASPQQGLWVGNGTPVTTGSTPASHSSPSAGWLSGTSGSGTNIAGADLNLAAGRGTGTGAGGAINLYTSIAGTTGTTRNAAVAVLSVQSAGTAGRVVLTDAVDISVGTVTGSKIGLSGEKLGFYGVTPIAQPTGWSGTNHTTTTALDTSTATLADVLNIVATLVEKLKELGLLGG